MEDRALSFGRGKRLESVSREISKKENNELREQFQMISADDYTNESIQRVISILSDGSSSSAKLETAPKNKISQINCNDSDSSEESTSGSNSFSLDTLADALKDSTSDRSNLDSNGIKESTSRLSPSQVSETVSIKPFGNVYSTLSPGKSNDYSFRGSEKITPYQFPVRSSNDLHSTLSTFVSNDSCVNGERTNGASSNRYSVNSTFQQNAGVHSMPKPFQLYDDHSCLSEENASGPTPYQFPIDPSSMPFRESHSVPSPFRSNDYDSYVNEEGTSGSSSDQYSVNSSDEPYADVYFMPSQTKFNDHIITNHSNSYVNVEGSLSKQFRLDPPVKPFGDEHSVPGPFKRNNYYSKPFGVEHSVPGPSKPNNHYSDGNEERISGSSHFHLDPTAKPFINPRSVSSQILSNGCSTSVDGKRTSGSSSDQFSVNSSHKPFKDVSSAPKRKVIGRGQRLRMVADSLPTQRTLQSDINMACGTDYTNQSIENFVEKLQARNRNTLPRK